MSHKLLLADDSLTIQKVVELTFSRADFELRTVGSGDKAVALLEEFSPDVVLADAVMPGLTGYEVCEAVKQRPGGQFVPVVLLTGTFEPFDRGRAERVGCDSIVTKPFDSHGLVTLVRGLVEKARIARETAPPPAPPEPEVVTFEEPAFAEDLLSDAPSFAEEPAFVSDAPSPVFTEDSVFVEESAFSPELAFEPEPAPPPQPVVTGPIEVPELPEVPAEPEPDLYATSAIQIPSLEDLRAMEARKRESELAEQPPAPFAPESGAGAGAEAGAEAIVPPMAVSSPTPLEVPFDEQVTAELVKPSMDDMPPLPEVPAEEPIALDVDEPLPPAAPVDQPLELAPPMAVEPAQEELPIAEPVAEELAPAPFEAADEPPAAAEEPLAFAEAAPEPPVFEAEAAGTTGPIEMPPVEPFPLEEPPVLGFPEDEAVETPQGDIEEAIAAYEREHPGPAARRRLEQEEEALAAAGRQVAAATEGTPPEQVESIDLAPTGGDLEALAAQSDLKALIPTMAPSSGSGPLSDADVERIARRVADLIGERVIRDVAWEVVPEMAERLVRARLAELEG